MFAVWAGFAFCRWRFQMLQWSPSSLSFVAIWCVCVLDFRHTTWTCVILLQLNIVQKSCNYWSLKCSSAPVASEAVLVYHQRTEAFTQFRLTSLCNFFTDTTIYQILIFNKLFCLHVGQEYTLTHMVTSARARNSGSQPWFPSKHEVKVKYWTSPLDALGEWQKNNPAFPSSIIPSWEELPFSSLKMKPLLERCFVEKCFTPWSMKN